VAVHGHIADHFGSRPTDRNGRSRDTHRNPHLLPIRVERAHKAGLPIKELCRRHGFSEASYYLWRSKFGGMSISDAKRLKGLETENSRLKKLLAEAMLENEVTREALRKKW
jgi:putative transposase